MSRKKQEPKKNKIDLMAILGGAEKHLKLKESPLVQLDPNRLKDSMPHISTGSLNVDYLIGGRENSHGVKPCPGIPRAKLTNIYGQPGAGKTTLALQTVASACADGGVCVYIDYENEVEPRYAQELGVPVSDPSRFMLLQPDTLEHGFELMKRFAIAGVDVIIVDSVGAGVPAKNLEKEYGETNQVGLLAKRWSDFLPEFKGYVVDGGRTAVIGISQLRDNINTGGSRFAKSYTVQGGNAWKFYSSLQIMLKVIGRDKGVEWDGLQQKMVETERGNLVRAKLDKCKVSASKGHEASFIVANGIGIDNERSVLDLAILTNVVSKKGSWYSWVNPKDNTPYKGQGLNGFRSFLPDNWLEIMFNQVRPFLNGDSKVEEVSQEDTDLLDTFFSDSSSES